MTELLHDIDTPSDAELISRVRGGDVAAYGDLFSRHIDAANRLARQLVRGPDADDLVSEAFAKVLSVLQGGGGPDVAFRAYLLTAVRRLHVDKIRAGSKLQTTDDLTPFDPGIPFQDTAVAGFESGAAAKAFASLPERWQLVLWHLEVEGQKPADIAPLLGMSANSVSALAYRAREGLRQAFLTMHLSDISETDCRWVNEHLGAYVRSGLSKRDTGKVKSHLDECRRCTAMYLELTEVNSNLSGIIAPLLLGAAATGYLASSGGAGAAGVLGLVGRARDFVAANSGAAAAGAVAVGVTAAAVVGIALTTGHPKDTTIGADAPVGTVSTAPATPGATKSGADKSPGASQAASRAAAAASGSASGSPTVPAPAGFATTPATAPGAVPPALAPSDSSVPGTSASAATTPSNQAPSNPQSGNQPSGSTAPPTKTTSPSPTKSPSPSKTPSPTGTPTGDPTTTPPGTPTPTPPVTVVADVQVQATFGNTGVTLTAHGDTGLPLHLDVALTSTPGGITFGTGGSCSLSSSATVAHCTTLGGSGGTALARSGAAVPAPGTFTASLPFVIPAGQQTTSVVLDVTTPDEGYRVVLGPGHSDGLVFKYVPPALPEAPLVMSLTPTSVTPDANGLYHLAGHVEGIPSGVGSLTFDLSPNVDLASFPESCALTTDPSAQLLTGVQHLTCPTTPGSSNLDIPVVLNAPDVLPAPVTFTVQVPDGYVDTSPGLEADNVADATLEHALGLSLPDTTQEDGSDPKANTFTLDANLTWIPDGTTEVTLSADPPVTFVDGGGCTAGENSVTCPVSGDPAPTVTGGTAMLHPVISYDGENELPVTLTATTTPGGASATAQTMLQPEATGALKAEAKLARGEANHGTLTVSVTGAADGKELSFKLAGASVDGKALRFTGVEDGTTCPVLADQSATCTSTGTTGTYVFGVFTPPGQLSGTVTVADGVHTDATATFGDSDAAATTARRGATSATADPTTTRRPTANPTETKSSTGPEPRHRSVKAHHRARAHHRAKAHRHAQEHQATHQPHATHHRRAAHITRSEQRRHHHSVVYALQSLLGRPKGSLPLP